MTRIPTDSALSKRAMIRNQAIGLFRKMGYNAASMRHLGKIVGIEAASLYNHMESKTALLKDICFEVATTFLTQLESVERDVNSQRTKIESIIRFHIHMMVKHFDKVYVSNRDWKHLKEPYLTEFLQHRRAYEKRLATIIEKGIEQKEFSIIQPRIAVLTILFAVRSIEFWQLNKGSRQTIQMENDLVKMLINGLTK